MQKPTFRSSQVPTIGSTGIRISSYQSSSLYMELHKLDYKKKVLIEKKLELEKQRQILEKKFSVIEKEMESIQKLLEKRNIQDEKTIDLQMQKLRY